MYAKKKVKFYYYRHERERERERERKEDGERQRGLQHDVIHCYKPDIIAILKSSEENGKVVPRVTRPRHGGSILFVAQIHNSRNTRHQTGRQKDKTGKLNSSHLDCIKTTQALLICFVLGIFKGLSV